MQNGSMKTGRGVMVNGTVSTLKRQPRVKMPSSRQERGSCSSTASCPVISGSQSDLDEEPPPRCPSSLSSPTLHKPGSSSSLKGSVSSLQGSLSNVKGSLTSLKSFPTSLALQSSSFSLRSSSPSLRSSSSSQRSVSSSEDDSWDTNSWSSGATCLLRSSIKQHSEEVFRVRVGSMSRPEGTSDSETGYQNSDSCQGSVAGSESQEGVDPADVGRRDSVSSAASTVSTDLEQKIEEKLKFSQFLDEVTCRVLDPECLQAFGAPLRQKEPSVASSLQSLCSPWIGSSRDSACNSRDSAAPVPMCKWAKCMPSCKILDTNESLRRTQEELSLSQTLGRTYLETDIDRVRREDEVSSTYSRDVEKRTVHLSGRCPSPASKRSDGAPQPPYRSTSLPRPAASTTMDGDCRGGSSAQEQKEDLRRRLGCSTHRLQQLQSEFESTRLFLETELRRAQDELDKFTEKLRRIQSSYAALQRINQDMEEKIHRMTQRYEEEKRSLNREVFTLNNRLMEAKITIQKLREDNDLYRKDCNLAAQLLQCGKSPNRTHKLSELPADLQKRLSSHMEQQGCGRSVALRQPVPAAIIGRVLEKPEPGRSCPVTRSPSPQVQEFTSGSDKGQRRVAYKTSDLYCSDTALYCPNDERRNERWSERRQSADQSGQMTEHTDPEDQDPFHAFMLGSLPASGWYSSFSTAPEEKPRALSSSQQVLFTDWHDGADDRKESSSFRKERAGFLKSSSFQHVSHASENGGSPAHRRLASGYGTSTAHGEGLRSVHPMDGWMSMEDMNSFSICSAGRISPLSFSERHFAIGPKIKLSPLYSSFREGDDVFRTRPADPHLSASAGSSPALNTKISLNMLKAERGQMFRSKGSSSRFFMSENTTEKENTAEASQRDDPDESPGSSVESLNQSLDVQHYNTEPHGPGAQKNTAHYQKVGNTGLSRKNSLTKAQLYGTLMN